MEGPQPPRHPASTSLAADHGQERGISGLDWRPSHPEGGPGGRLAKRGVVKRLVRCGGHSSSGPGRAACKQFTHTWGGGALSVSSSFVLGVAWECQGSGCQGGTRIIARPIIVSVRLCVAVVPVGGLRSTTPGFVFVSCPTVASSISGDRLRSVSSCASLLLRTCAHPACSPRPALTPAVAVLRASPVLSSFSTALTALPLCSLPLGSHFLSSPPGSRLQSPISPASLSRGEVLLNWSNCCGFVHIKA